MTRAAGPLSVSHLSKKFARDLRRALWYGVCDTAREVLARSHETPLRTGEFWAVDDVSFVFSSEGEVDNSRMANRQLVRFDAEWD